MSLTSHLKDPNSPVKQFLCQQLSQTRCITKVTNKQLRERSTINPGFPPLVYSHLGRAMDYLIRYSFAITPYKKLVAWRGAGELISKPWESDEDIILELDEIGNMPVPLYPYDAFGNALEAPVAAQGPYPLQLIQSFFTSLETTLSAIQPVGRRLEKDELQLLARYCFVLGLFEEVYRSPYYIDGPLMVPAPKESVDALLAIPEDAWIDDLCAMSWLFYDNYSHLLSQSFTLNPTFAGSGDVGGADADMIVNGCLIDMKATTLQKIDADWLRQLAGYVLLDYDDAHHIDSVGIYMARQGILFTWPLTDFLSQLTADSTTSLPQLRQQFRMLCQPKQSKKRK